jgi:hypothetical protein
MNFTESFEEFSKGIGTTDLILYAGVALVVWILFKDKLSPLQSVFSGLTNTVKTFLNKKASDTIPTTQPVVTNTPIELLSNSITEKAQPSKEDLFFRLIVSWKETRDLALECGCDDAVSVADSMFPHLSPNVCGKDKENVQF